MVISFYHNIECQNRSCDESLNKLKLVQFLKCQLSQSCSKLSSSELTLPSYPYSIHIIFALQWSIVIHSVAVIINKKFELFVNLPKSGKICLQNLLKQPSTEWFGKSNWFWLNEVINIFHAGKIGSTQNKKHYS